MSPWTLLLPRESESTLPAFWCAGASSGIRSTKLDIDALECGRLRVGDVARDVFQREGLRAQAGDRRGESAEDTHYEPPQNPGGQRFKTAWP